MQISSTDIYVEIAEKNCSPWRGPVKRFFLDMDFNFFFFFLGVCLTLRTHLGGGGLVFAL